MSHDHLNAFLKAVFSRLEQSLQLAAWLVSLCSVNEVGISQMESEKNFFTVTVLAAAKDYILPLELRHAVQHFSRT